MTEFEHDLREPLNAIRRKYGANYHLSPAALWEAAALWGVTPETGGINDCGVFNALEDSTTLRQGECRVTITLVQAPNGYWAMSTGYQTRLGGRTYAPSIWCEVAYPNRDDARLAALWELLGDLKMIVENRRLADKEINRRELCHMIDMLEAEKTPQLSLF